ncbi:MAG TPA: hypothetical protein VHR17_06560 [Thermoanaerobaculia bacterium]|nr:hypothetical protein [Thermoanaerobaculia bacterium]
MKSSTTEARPDAGSKTRSPLATGASVGATANDATRGPAIAASTDSTATVDDECAAQQSESLGADGARWQVERVVAAGQATAAHMAAAEIDIANTVSATQAPNGERLIVPILSIR